MSEDSPSPDDPELLRRVAVFRGQLRPGQATPVLHLPDAPRHADPLGTCVSCGTKSTTTFRCALCAEAARRALVEGPLPSPA